MYDVQNDVKKKRQKKKNSSHTRKKNTHTHTHKEGLSTSLPSSIDELAGLGIFKALLHELLFLIVLSLQRHLAMFNVSATNKQKKYYY